MTNNGPQWDSNGYQWIAIVYNGSQWVKMAYNALQWTAIVYNGFYWIAMTNNGLINFQPVIDSLDSLDSYRVDKLIFFDLSFFITLISTLFR